jgi:zinc protease
MKKLTWCVVFSMLCGGTPAAAQEDYASVSEVAGVTVLYRHIPRSSTVSAAVYLLGGPGVAGEAVAGIEPLYLRVGAYGSAGYPGAESRLATSALGASISVSEGTDWTAYRLTALTEDFAEVWNVFADRLTAPELEQGGLDAERRNIISVIEAAGDQPGSLAVTVAEQATFLGHPYRMEPSGTSETLEGITTDHLRAFGNDHVVKSRLLVVIVGGASREVAEQAVASTLGTLPVGTYEWSVPDLWGADETTLTVESRDLPTNYIHGYFGGPAAMDDVYPAFRLAVSTLGGVVFQAIRSEGLSYAAGAPVIERAAAGGSLYVSTTKPKEAMKIINEGIQLMKDVTFRRSALQDYARNSAMNYFIRNETPLSQARYLARAYLYRGRVQSPDAYVQELLDISPGVVRRMANDYFKNIQWAYVGKASQVPESEMKKN